MSKSGYWTAVCELIMMQYKLSVAASRRAVLNYKIAIAEAGVGDTIYHVSVEETAKGIVQGGYVEDGPYV